jgi:hypothetical protein
LHPQNNVTFYTPPYKALYNWISTFCHSGRSAGISYECFFLNGDPGIPQSLPRVYHGAPAGMTCSHKRFNPFANRSNDIIFDFGHRYVSVSHIKEVKNDYQKARILGKT